MADSAGIDGYQPVYSAPTKTLFYSDLQPVNRMHRPRAA